MAWMNFVANLFFNFEGRISRQPFWIGVGILAVAEVVGQQVATQLQGNQLAAIIDLLFAYPEFALCLKRAHDRDIPTWVIAIYFCGSVLLDFFTVAGLDTDVSGADRSNPIFIFSLLLLTLTLVLLVDLGCRRGTQGPNRFGPDPLEHAGT